MVRPERQKVYRHTEHRQQNKPNRDSQTYRCRGRHNAYDQPDSNAYVEDYVCSEDTKRHHYCSAPEGKTLLFACGGYD